MAQINLDRNVISKNAKKSNKSQNKKWLDLGVRAAIEKIKKNTKYKIKKIENLRVRGFAFFFLIPLIRTG